MATPSRRSRKRGGKPSRGGPPRERIQELHPVADPPQIESFREWDLGDEIQRAIANMDITVPTPIQRLTIGPVLEGRDVIAKAETGTGKTLAFGGPMMARIDPARSTVLGLVLCPTRELAQQVGNVLAALGLTRGVRVALVVGGDPMHPQIAALQAGAQVVVGTPGRVLDLYQQRFLSFPWTEFAVLDEADKMFEIGFFDDVRKILSFLPDERQTLLFSATFPTEVLKLARAETREPLEVATAKGTVTVEAIEQKWMEVADDDRPLVLTRMLEQSGSQDVFLVFCDRRTEVDRLMRRLDRLPWTIKALHGGFDQASRFRVMSAFRTGEVKALVATDVASRGLDVEHVSHVVNFSVPRDLEDYAHRIGRTGRAGRAGNAITFVTAADRRRWRALLERAHWPIEELDPPGRTRGDGRRRPGARDARDAREPDAREERGRGAGDRPRRGRRAGRPRPASDGEGRNGGFGTGV
jgi:ATP-dependent RNA helicase DeaD